MNFTTIDHLESDTIQITVLQIVEGDVLTFLTDSTKSDVVFSVNSQTHSQLSESFVSYRGLELLSDQSRYTKKPFNYGSDECEYCGEPDQDSVNIVRSYMIDNKTVFSIHPSCLSEFCTEISQIVEQAKPYGVSSNL